MNQPGKLDTISPSLRQAASAITSAPATSATANKNSQNNVSSNANDISISTGRAAVEPSPEGINISLDDTAKASVAFFSLQYFLTVLPGWSVSLVGHAVLLVLLTVIATSPLLDTTAVRLDGLLLDTGTVPDAEEMFPDTEMTEMNLLKVDVAALNSEASTETTEIIRDNGFHVSLLEGMSDGIGLEAMSDTGLTPLPTADEGGVAGETDGTSTQFFGTQAIGSRFVFIIDASDSMNEGFRWHQAVRELEASIDKLSKDQKALVLLYNFQTFPMFNTPPDQLKLLPVTEEFKTRLSQWLGRQVPIGGTRPAFALEYSLTLDPDAIFLLSDGMLADNSIQILAKHNAARDPKNGDFTKVPIHTVSLGPNVLGAQLMKLIADNNDGEFTWEK